MDCNLTVNLFTLEDDERPVYIAGSFNSWKSRDEVYRMLKKSDGHYQYCFAHGQMPEGPIEYKFLKGGWEAEELDRDGFPPSNRRLEVPKGHVNDLVPLWKKHADWYNPSFYPEIVVLSDRFAVPQLRRRRRVSVLLPWDYHTSKKKYPVLYLQDGQNLFDNNAPFGTWGVDKQMAALAESHQTNFIVVAIDHGGKERIKEYLPHPTLKWGDALGKQYAAFLKETLKPYIDTHFRTLPDREHTGIGGSSMGGLISLHAGIAYPEVYSKFMIFSPSLWAAPSVFTDVRFLLQQSPTQFYLYVGGKEPALMLKDAEKLHKQLMLMQPDPYRLSLQFSVQQDAGHNESAWGREFPKSASWLFSHLR
jgi:predicted alpha/beta superfamily hydrolase